MTFILRSVVCCLRCDDKKKIMKNKFGYLIVVASIGFTSCNNAENSAMETSDSTVSVSTNENSSQTGYVSPYMDLKTNSPVYIDRDSLSNNYLNRDTRQPLGYYYDPITRDTFDSRGRIVNGALVLTNGDYTIEEARITSNDDAFKLKYDDMKVKIDDDGTKMKDDDIKIKIKDGKYKEKTDSTKIKIEDDEIKIKEK